MALALCARSALASGTAYDPLAVAAGFTPKTIELTVHDAGRNRDIPLRVYLPLKTSPAPVVLFSHGLGGSREGSKYLGDHWAARGYVVVFIQHPGSDSSVWSGKPLAEAEASLRTAASVENFVLRAADVRAVLDQLERWQADKRSALNGRLDLERIGMSGHSFGALTTQAVSGQTLPLSGRSATDSRIKAAIMFSPSSPRRDDPQHAFHDVGIPWMLMTGTKDVAPIGDADVASRLAVFPALPAGGKYEVVLFEAQHSAFTDRPLPGDTGQRNPNHHRVVLALSTAFFDAYLRQEPAAKLWLDGDGPRSVLEKADRWQKK